MGIGGPEPLTGGQMRGNPVDPRIYPEATCLQNPWPEAHLVKFEMSD